ncbi:MAG: hypothetical protein JO019_05130 [Candidatus Kaiserbacteria bacterium]|nr:hypothetical protein [Candidatus Kaiserbacteria bacterium]
MAEEESFKENGADMETPPRSASNPRHSQSSQTYSNDPGRRRERPDSDDPHQP